MVAAEAIQDRDTIRSRLEPGEQVVWIGKPSAWRFARNMLWDVTVGLPVTVILAYLASRIPAMEQPAQLLLLLPALPFMLLLGPGLLLAPLIGLFMAHKTVYVLTDRRALVVMGSRKTYCFSPDKLQDLTCKANRDGSGDVIFERRFRSKRPNHISFVDVGFLGIPDVRQVEMLVRGLVRTVPEAGQLLVPPPVAVNANSRPRTWAAFVIVLMFIPLSMYAFGTSYRLTLNRSQDGRVDGVVHYRWMDWIPLYNRSIADVRTAELVEGLTGRGERTYKIVLHTGRGPFSTLGASNMNTRAKGNAIQQINAFTRNPGARSAEIYVPAEAPVVCLVSVSMLVLMEVIIVRDLRRRQTNGSARS